MNKKLGYAFTWLTNKKGETKNLDDFILPVRDIILDVQATTEVLCNLRQDIDYQVAIDTAITLVEKQSGVDLSAFRNFLSIVHLDNNSNEER